MAPGKAGRQRAIGAGRGGGGAALTGGARVAARASLGWAIPALAIAASLPLAACAKRYDARGVVLRVEPEARQVTLSHEPIPGYMDAMVMPLAVRPPASIEAVAPGDRVAFRLRVSRRESWIDRLRTLSAPRTDAGLLDSPAVPRLVAIGAPVPDFALVNQHGARVSLASLRGQVVAVTFIYTRCPLPDYCPLMTANFQAIARQFAPRLGRDLTLLTVTFDPGFDTSAVLADYARAHGAEQAGWHFLTGSASEIGRVCEAFGLEFWPEEGLITHALQTAVIDRDGRLAGTIEGKEYASRQLADLIGSVLEH